MLPISFVESCSELFKPSSNFHCKFGYCISFQVLGQLNFVVVVRLTWFLARKWRLIFHLSLFCSGFCWIQSMTLTNACSFSKADCFESSFFTVFQLATYNFGSYLLYGENEDSAHNLAMIFPEILEIMASVRSWLCKYRSPLFSINVFCFHRQVSPARLHIDRPKRGTVIIIKISVHDFRMLSSTIQTMAHLESYTCISKMWSTCSYKRAKLGLPWNLKKTFSGHVMLGNGS